MKLKTFGRAHVARDDDEEVALQPLPVAVLVYLALGGPRDRDHLADLFWHKSKNGLNSLSTTLNRIRAEVPGGVWVRGNSLVGTDLASDVDDLRDAIDRGDFSSVAQLYDAPFLGTLRLRKPSIEFEEWVLDQRSTVASMVEMALLQRGSDLSGAGDHEAAASAAEQAWEIATRDGFPSPDYFEQYHRILASAASPAASAVRSMAEELGIALSPVGPVAFDVGTELAESSAPIPAPFADGQPTPAAAPPLFGCRQELTDIASSVASNKLTTVVGLGGSGKTRLASEFFNSATTVRDYPHRYWVDLRDVADHDLVAPAIATSLGQRFDTIASLADRLPDDESVLVVLDNYENVLRSASIAEELAHSATAIRVLVTSRLPLEVETEALVPLTGLEIEGDEQGSPAEHLFMASARRSGVNDARLNGLEQTAIRDVCRRVGGNPLALEIAGGWTQILSPAEILDALSVDNELLDAPMSGDLRSMDAVLNQSWWTLREAEQHTLMLLATFPGGCLTTEALKVPDLSIKSIGQLVQNSLARLQAEGRITLHPLVAGHALSELEQRPDLHREFRQVLSNWCQQFATASPSESSTTHAQMFEPEIANFAAAWSWDAQHRLWDLHRATLDSLRSFFTQSGRLSEGRALFALVADALRSDPHRPHDLLAQILEAIGWFEMLAGDVAKARKRLDEALVLSRGKCPPQKLAQLLKTRGALQFATGEVDQAAENWSEALALIADEPCALAASLQYDLAQAHHYRGARDKAKSAARSALRAGRTDNNWSLVCRSYLLLADIEVESDPQRAVVLLNEGWAIAKDASLDHLAIYFPHILGLAHLNLNEAERAEEYFAAGMNAASDVGELSTLCANYVGRAEARLLRNEPADAIDDLKTGIRLALKTGSGRYLIWAAVVSCRAAARQDSRGQAMELLSLALRHPAGDQDARDKAVQTWRDLFDDAPHPNAEAAPDVDVIDLDEVAERSLELLTVR